MQTCDFGRRKDEIHCRKAFDAFLKLHYVNSDIVWLSGGHPRPDYYLKLCDTKYAVEVTSIIREEIKINGDYKSEIGSLITVRNFLKQLEQKAAQSGTLTGAYSVRYKPIDNFGKQKRRIEKFILEYIRNTQEISSSQWQELLKGEGDHVWYIKKRHSEKKRLSGTTDDMKWGKPVDELCNLLNKSLKTKADTMKNIILPKVLLLYDKYPWIDAAEWRQYLSKLSYVDNFHTIFLVSEKSRNSILHSIEGSWFNQLLTSYK